MVAFCLNCTAIRWVSIDKYQRVRQIIDDKPHSVNSELEQDGAVMTVGSGVRNANSSGQVLYSQLYPPHYSMPVKSSECYFILGLLLRLVPPLLHAVIDNGVLWTMVLFRR